MITYFRDRPLQMLMIMAFLARMVAIWLTGASAIRFGDGRDYLSAAASVCTSGSYPVGSSLPFFRAPGLPFFAAATTLCHTGSVWVVKCSLAIVGTITVGILYFLTRHLFGREQTGLIASAITAMYPAFILQSTDIQTEGLFMFLLLASILAEVKAVSRPSLSFVAGACASMAALVRPVGLVLLVLLPLWVFCSGATIIQRRKYFRSWAMFLAGAAVFLAPWTIRNAVQFHELILVNDGAGYNFWRGTSAELARINAITDRAAFEAASTHFETVVWPSVDRQVDQVAATPAARSNEWYRIARQDFVKEPGPFLLRLLQNAWMFWRPWLNPATSSTATVVLSGLVVSFLYVTALLGWASFYKRHKRMALWFALYALSFWLLQVPFQVVSRFRIPIVDPICIVFAAGYLSTLFSERFDLRPRMHVRRA